MSFDVVIRLDGVTKRYRTYAKPEDRLKQSAASLLHRVLGLPARQYFREFTALEGVTLEIRKGETLGVLGRNGAGKSTLLQLICGTLAPSEGAVTSNGRIAALLELGSGFNPEFTGRENVYLNASILGLSREETDARFQSIVEFSEIGDFIDQPVKTYSSGMVMRLAFSVVAHVDADILVIDEALSVGDAFFAQKCLRFLRGFKEKGTLLFVSHDSGAVVNLCSRAILLSGGRVKMEGAPKTVSEYYLAAEHHATNALAPVALPPRTEAAPPPPAPSEQGDRRNGRAISSELEVIQPLAPLSGFGTGDAKIAGVRLLGPGGAPLSYAVGGDEVIVEVVCDLFKQLEFPLVGFQVKDRLGQVLFGDNTFLTYQGRTPSAPPGGRLTARFAFRLPILPTGDYSVDAAIATGTQLSHVHHHWARDIMIFRVHASSITFGLVGVPMREISLEVSDVRN